MSWTGLPEFANDTITDYNRPSPSIETDSPTVIKTNKVETVRKPSGNSQNIIDDKGYWDSSCSRHMTGNISYLSDYEPYNGGYVSFRQGGGKITVVTDDFPRLTWTFFLKTKDETSGILRNFITEIENLKYLKVKIIRCDNRGEFKNRDMNEFCFKKGIKREFSNARTPQQNGVVERRNKTLIEAARTMLANAKLPVTFWAEAVNTACYVQNKVLVNKSQNKTLYELFNSKTPAIGFLKPFGCHVMILNTLDHIGKFDAKGDEGYFISTPRTQYSAAGQFGGVTIAERKNRTLIEAAKTMMADSLLPIPFWAEAINTACYVQNRVLVTKPHNKTPYELLHGRTPSIDFMRPFGCPMTILNTLDSLGKFDVKVDEGFLVGYSVSSKAFRVFNSRTRIVQETLHVNFLENKPNVACSGPTWLFDIDTLAKTMNYQPVTAGNQTNPSAGFQDKFDAEKAGEESDQQYVLFPVWSSGSTNP
nr:putative ribonuclease H-like domain-containing protein [Tanacetum cinerariifolium]